MENRRQTFRLAFGDSEQVSVELLATETNSLRGELVDLSIDGMKVRLTGNPSLEVGGQLTSRLVGRAATVSRLRLSLPCQLKYVLHDGQHAYWGLHFLPSSSSPAREQRETTLARFLAEEQRRAMRQRLPFLEE